MTKTETFRFLKIKKSKTIDKAKVLRYNITVGITDDGCFPQKRFRDNRFEWKPRRLSLFVCEREDSNDRGDQSQNKTGELHELLEGYVIHCITSLRSEGEKKCLPPPKIERSNRHRLRCSLRGPKTVLIIARSFLIVKSQNRNVSVFNTISAGFRSVPRGSPTIRCNILPM